MRDSFVSIVQNLGTNTKQNFLNTAYIFLILLKILFTSFRINLVLLSFLTLLSNYHARENCKTYNELDTKKAIKYTDIPAN